MSPFRESISTSQSNKEKRKHWDKGSTATTATSAVPNKLVHDAPPPAMAVASMVLIASLAILAFPPMRSVDEVARPQVFTNRLFPSYISLPTLLYIRTCFAILCFAVTSFKLFLSPGCVLILCVTCAAYSLRPNHSLTIVTEDKLIQPTYHSPSYNETGFVSRAFANCIPSRLGAGTFLACTLLFPPTLVGPSAQ
jgi:hypothetical protein